MLHIGKESTYSVEEVLERAVKHFGPQGVGLEIEQQTIGAVQLVGAGGHVLVQAAPLFDGSEVDVQTQEFEYDARQFLLKV
jgi:hypothetical protein